MRIILRISWSCHIQTFLSLTCRFVIPRLHRMKISIYLSKHSIRMGHLASFFPSRIVAWGEQLVSCFTDYDTNLPPVVRHVFLRSGKCWVTLLLPLQPRSLRVEVVIAVRCWCINQIDLFQNICIRYEYFITYAYHIWRHIRCKFFAKISFKIPMRLIYHM